MSGSSSSSLFARLRPAAAPSNNTLVYGPRNRAWQKLAAVALACSIIITTSVMSEMANADEARPKVKIETTKGSIVIEVFTTEAPLSASNFLRLVDEGFYDGLIFHRVVANFVVQTGGYITGHRQQPSRTNPATE